MLSVTVCVLNNDSAKRWLTLSVSLYFLHLLCALNRPNEGKEDGLGEQREDTKAQQPFEQFQKHVARSINYAWLQETHPLYTHIHTLVKCWCVWAKHLLYVCFEVIGCHGTKTVQAEVSGFWAWCENQKPAGVDSISEWDLKLCVDQLLLAFTMIFTWAVTCRNEYPPMALTSGVIKRFEVWLRTRDKSTHPSHHSITWMKLAMWDYCSLTTVEHLTL